MQLEWFLLSLYAISFLVKQIISHTTVCHLSQRYDYKQSKPYDETDFCWKRTISLKKKAYFMVNAQVLQIL